MGSDYYMMAKDFMGEEIAELRKENDKYKKLLEEQQETSYLLDAAEEEIGITPGGNYQKLKEMVALNKKLEQENKTMSQKVEAQQKIINNVILRMGEVNGFPVTKCRHATNARKLNGLTMDLKLR